MITIGLYLKMVALGISLNYGINVRAIVDPNLEMKSRNSAMSSIKYSGNI
jgi:hypothetical protein